MSSRQARALALIAGNGATMAIIVQTLVAHPEQGKVSFNPNADVASLPLVFAMSAAGLALAYVALVLTERKHAFEIAEALSCAVFAGIVFVYALRLLGL